MGHISNDWMYRMSIRQRLIDLRHERDLTQQQMADAIGVHVNQVRRYEAGTTQPSIDVLKKMAIAFNITADWLLFSDGERDLPKGLQLKFEAVSQMSEEDQRVIQSLIDGMILKHTANQLTGS